MILDGNLFETADKMLDMKSILAGTTLKKFKARGCNINDNFGVHFGEHLCKCKSLSVLDLSNNMMTDESLRAFSISLKTNTVRIEHLKLHSNLFTDKEGIRFGEALKHNQFIKSVDLSNNNFTDVTAAVMITVLMRQTSV